MFALACFCACSPTTLEWHMRRHLAPMSFAESSPFTTPTSPPETGASIADEPKPAARVDCLSRAEATRRSKESGGRLRDRRGNARFGVREKGVFDGHQQRRDTEHLGGRRVFRAETRVVAGRAVVGEKSRSRIHSVFQFSRRCLENWPHQAECLCLPHVRERESSTVTDG